jgi:hypothetical protein
MPHQSLNTNISCYSKDIFKVKIESIMADRVGSAIASLCSCIYPGYADMTMTNSTILYNWKLLSSWRMEKLSPEKIGWNGEHVVRVAMEGYEMPSIASVEL